MKTEFNEFLSKIRKDSNESLRMMAKRLNISATFLSAMELGKRLIPLDYIAIISNCYELSNEDIKTLEDSIYKTNNKVTIDFENMSDEKKNVSLLFARTIKDIDENLVEKLMLELEKYENKDKSIIKKKN